MALAPPVPEQLVPCVLAALIDYPYFDEVEAPRLAEFASKRMRTGLAAYFRDASPLDTAGIIEALSHNPLLALQTIVERSLFLWRCSRDMEALAIERGGRRPFAGLKIRFCSFCRSDLANTEGIFPAEAISSHPLLGCSLPACNGTAYTVTKIK